MLSLIIPMYNSEQTIKQTLQSVVDQTVQFTEVIVVDNGSSDQSVAIVEKLCNEYTFIHLVHCAQRGVSAARNMGIDRATSEYIGFLDADDILELNYVEVLKSFILQNPNADMYHFNFYQQFKNGIIKENRYFLHDKTSYLGNEFMEKMLQTFSFETKHMVWTYVFRSDFLTKQQLRFRPEMQIFEDVLFLHQAFQLQSRICIVKESLITYRYHAHSLTDQMHEQHVLTSGACFVQAIQGKQKTLHYFEQLLSRVLSKETYVTFWLQNAQEKEQSIKRRYYIYKVQYFISRVLRKIHILR